MPSLSKTGTTPDAVVQPWAGPGTAFVYQPGKFAVGGVSGGGVLSAIVAQTLSALPHGEWNAAPLYEQPPATCASAMGALSAPTFVFTSRLIQPFSRTNRIRPSVG